MRRQKRLRKRILVLMILILLAVLSAAFFVIRKGRSGSINGVVLVPENEYPVSSFPCFLQNDETWAKDNLGDSRFTMGGSGCLTSCIAAALTAQEWSAGAEGGVTPGELNRLFSENQVYNKEGNIVWGKIDESFPDLETVVARKVDSTQIDRLLSGGDYPIVRVKNHGNGAWHWVLLVGTKDGDYLCMDPLNRDLELVPLSSHGGTVYSMRTVRRK